MMNVWRRESGDLVAALGAFACLLVAMFVATHSQEIASALSELLLELQVHPRYAIVMLATGVVLMLVGFGWMQLDADMYRRRMEKIPITTQIAPGGCVVGGLVFVVLPILAYPGVMIPSLF